MTKNIYKYLLFSILISTYACGSKKNIPEKQVSQQPIEVKQEEKKKDRIKTETPPNETKPAVVSYSQTTEDYVEKYADIAVKKMKEHGIPASITLAQGILESNSGKSALTRSSNNHFGIKCHAGWMGEKTYYDDDTKNECFRSYPEAEGSYEDHSLFLTTRSRYASLFNLEPGDYFAWAYGLRKAGYATDKKYPQKLIGIIEKYNLHKYDNIVLENIATPIITNAKTESNIHIVQKGETLYQIAQKTGVRVQDLLAYNQLSSEIISPGQKLLLISNNSKTDVTTPEVPLINETIEIPENHIVQVGETLYSIGQMYQLDIELLKKVNHLTHNNLSAGQLLVLNDKNYTEPETIEDSTKVANDNGNGEIVNITTQNPETHTVTAGQTLYQIAYLYHVEVKELRKLNAIEKDEIHIGQVLKLKSNIEDPQIDTSEQLYHTVEVSETLFSISKKHQVSVSDLKDWNHLKDNTIYLGQKLIIKK